MKKMSTEIETLSSFKVYNDDTDPEHKFIYVGASRSSAISGDATFIAENGDGGTQVENVENQIRKTYQIQGEFIDDSTQQGVTAINQSIYFHNYFRRNANKTILLKTLFNGTTSELLGKFVGTLNSSENKFEYKTIKFNFNFIVTSINW